MEIGDEFLYGDRKVKYTVLDILHKHKFEFDMFLCRHETSGVKECFQRQDLENPRLTQVRNSTRGRHIEIHPWTSEDILELKKFAKTRTIHTKFIPIGKHTAKAVQVQWSKMKRRGELYEN